jgi:hypothetical protein
MTLILIIVNGNVIFKKSILIQVNEKNFFSLRKDNRVV